MKIGYFGKQNSFALEMLKRLQLEHSRDEFLAWQPGQATGARDTAASNRARKGLGLGNADSVAAFRNPFARGEHENLRRNGYPAALSKTGVMIEAVERRKSYKIITCKLPYVWYF